MKKIIAILLSFLIMGIIFSRIDLGAFRNHLVQADPWLFLVALLFFIPQILISAFRWKVMIEDHGALHLWEAVKLNLSCCALNILLPSRVGDLSKAYFMGRDGRVDMKRGMNVVFFEKYIDLASLGVVVLTGVLFSRHWDKACLAGLIISAGVIGFFPALYFVNLERWTRFSIFKKIRLLAKIRELFLDSQDYLAGVRRNRGLAGFIVSISIFLWFVHVLQFYMIFLAFHSHVSLFHVFRLVPLAILVGLIPLTIAGMGTRDSALIYLFAPFESSALVAGVGLFASLRYFVPGILGLPFLSHYIVKKKPAE